MNDFFQRMIEQQNRLNPALSLYDHLFRMQSAFKLPKGVIDVVKAQQIWRDRLNMSVVPYVGGLNSISKMLSHETFFKHAGTIQMCNALRMSSYASLSLIQYNKFGSAINLSKKFNNNLFNNLKSLSRSYNHLLETSEKLPTQFATNQKLFENLPALSFYKATSFVKSISDVEEIELEIEDADINELVDESYPEDINQYLNDVGEDVLKLWVEARSALLGDYLGNERHCFLCLRELFTHILHRIAPDTELKRWSNNPKHIINGRFTRAARLEFVYNSVNFSPFDDFLKADIIYTEKIISTLQRIHEVNLSMTQLQKKFIFEKSEVALKLLIEAKRNKK